MKTPINVTKKISTSVLLLLSLSLASCRGTPAPEVAAPAEVASVATEIVQSTATSVPPTDTPIPPTATVVPPTDTPVPPTDTPTPKPTDTPVLTDTPTSEPTDTPAPKPTSTPLPTHTSVPPPTNTPKPTCPYQGDSDAATIANIIHAEAEAANKEDISIIQAIFAPDAYSQSRETGEEWRDPVSRYTGLFEYADFTDAIHFGIQPTGEGITADTAWFISGSSGTFIPNDGEPYNYNNEPGKDSWVLKKNHLGCWVIVEFRF